MATPATLPPTPFPSSPAKTPFKPTRRNSLRLNTLTQSHSLASSSSNPESAILLYLNLLQHHPLTLDPFTFPPLIKACTKIDAFSVGTHLHAHSIKLGFIADVYIANSLIHMYFCFGRSRDARKLFDRMSDTNVVTWNCVIGGYAELGMWQNVIVLFRAMVGESGVAPNSITLARAVTACSRAKDVEMGRWVHRYIAESGVEVGLKLGNALVNMYAKFGEMGEARRLFDGMVDRDVVSWTTLVSGYASAGDVGVAREVFGRMPERNVVAWNAMIAGYVLNASSEEAVSLYKEMLVLGVKADKATHVSVLSACARSGDLFTGKAIHGYISKVNLETTLDLLHCVLGLYSKCGEMESAELLFKKMSLRNEITWTLMIEGYIKCGAKGIALDIFKQMPYKDTASWNALISALVQHSHYSEALNTFEDMQRLKVAPNCLTLVSTLSACARIGTLELGKWIHAYIERNNIEMDSHLSSSLVDMYAKCGCIESALRVFDSMPEKDLLAWSTMIGGLAVHGRSKLALEYFKQMEDCGERPDAITFIGILSACSHAGLLEEGQYYFELMTGTYCICPGMEHYSCMVDLFARHGLLKETKDLIEKMSISSNGEAIWGALLSACKLHGNVELAEYASSRLLEVDPTNSGAYVQLSNLYAKASKWEEVGKLRNVMKGKGVAKAPGCSSIEVNGDVHEFFACDSSHPESGDIYMLLNGLEKLMEEHQVL